MISKVVKTLVDADFKQLTKAESRIGSQTSKCFEVADANKSIARDIYTKYDPIAKEMYKYEPVAEHYVEEVPTIAYWSEKNIRLFNIPRRKGTRWRRTYRLILADGIAKVFADDRRASTISSNVQ
ncbi:hypothetical protein Goshw_016939 [Gossypium schwendimanii]|uniref:Uncharacterized protein n=1 Tax=Gossypium schwendimanii TaxID=34291 RepID=A0A7J9LX06_GOSSC|nr:hypothetical protein [Gossypium schwendimanii]